MITFEHDAVLKNFATRQKDSLQPRRTRPGDGRAIYLSQSDFGPLQGRRLLPKLADFNLCFPGVENQEHLSAIQAHRYHAPEVLLGCPWSYSVDIWNLGLLVRDKPPVSFCLAYSYNADVEPPGRYQPVRATCRG